ncbi:hypothetical protein AMJ80_02235 [bacterium SM23_31]|nr:MAG: hypothetical protein AMJ80_02235 [bacterium SM23_31]
MLTVAGCAKQEETGNIQEEQIPVYVTTVQKGDIKKTLKLTGNIEPWESVNIMPDISGKVKKIYVDNGDFVKEGQVLAELDTRSMALILKQAEAGLSVAESNYNDASKNWERIKTLFEKGTATSQQYEKAQLGYEAAKAQLEQAKAAFDIAQYQLDVSIMKAPFSGIIASKNMNEQETINPMMPGGQGVLTLADLSKVKIHVAIPENQFRDVLPGLDALLHVDAYSDEVFTGEVTKINPTADPLSRTFGVEIVVLNENILLRAGMFARVELTIKEKIDVPLIPVECVVKTANENYVFVIENGTAHRRNITFGLSESSMIEITDGLQIGEYVVTVGKEMLKDGSLVQIKENVVK